MANAKKLPSGSWRCVASYTDAYGKLHQKSFTASTKYEAELMAAEFLVKTKEEMKPEGRTLGKLMDDYIDNRSNALSPSTIAGYRKIRKHAFPQIIDTKAGQITKEMYQKAINEYAKNHAPKTVANAQGFANAVFQSVDMHTAEKAIIPPLEKTEIEIPTKEEVQMLLEATKGTRVDMTVKLALYLGLRHSEIIGLQWRDVDLTRKRVHICRAMVKDEFGIYTLKGTKTYESNRYVPIPAVLLPELSKKGSPNDPVVNDSADAIYSLYQRTCEKIGFNYNFHALRHYFASVLLALGYPNLYAQKLMGHHTDRMLKQVYQHIIESKSNELNKTLDNYFSGLGNLPAN